MKTTDRQKLPSGPAPAADGAAMPPVPIRAMMSMPCANLGVGATCRSILRGAVANGATADLFTSRNDSPAAEAFAVRDFTPRPLARLPYRLTRRLSLPRLHRAFIDAIRPGEIAYLWPSVPYAVFEELHRRGVTIVTEAVNTRMADARAVLDAEFARLGVAPTHRITDDRIADEEARLALASAIFSPSPATDASLSRSPHAARVIPASYGTDPRARPIRRPPKPAGAPVTFLFVGLSSVRKGLQHLLRAWEHVPMNARLRIVGLREPQLFGLYPDVFLQTNVSVAGFTANLDAEYAQADVFILPSLEEGDPIVTYEAAAAGLPILASPAGAGRIGAETGAVVTFDTSDTALLRHQIIEFTRSEDLRREWAAMALAASANYRWDAVAGRRMTRLAGHLGRRDPG